MQVADLRREGVGARSTFVAGPPSWVGDAPPTFQQVEGRYLLEIGLLRLDVFAAWKAQIFGNCEAINSSGLDSNFGPLSVGSTTRVYGHLVVPAMV